MIKKLLAALVALGLLTSPVYAAQDILTINPAVPGGDTGTSLANKLNDWRTAILTMLSGSSRPSAATTGTLWLDTTSSTWAVKLYNGTSDTTLFTVDSTNLRPIFAGAVPWVDGGGTANAITATYSPVIGSLIDGTLVGVRATAANTTTTPTFQANATTAKTIVKANNQPLLTGDIAGNSHELLLRYASDIDKWVLLNPAIAAVAANSVNSSSIVDESITSADILNGTITGTDIAGATITGSNIASNTIATGNIVDGTLTNADLSTTTVKYLKYPGEVIQTSALSCPTGSLEADGSAISRTVYSVLFGVLSTSYGVGDGSTTFNIPDYRGRFLRGWDHGAGTDPDAASRTDRGDGTTGDNVGTKQVDGFKSHDHNFTDNGTGNESHSRGTSSQVTAADNNAANDTTNNTGGNETRPKNINVLFCIFTGV